jgi:hypothetical protein
MGEASGDDLSDTEPGIAGKTWRGGRTGHGIMFEKGPSLAMTLRDFNHRVDIRDRRSIRPSGHAPVDVIGRTPSRPKPSPILRYDTDVFAGLTGGFSGRTVCRRVVVGIGVC